MEVLHRTSKWGEVRRLACPLRRFPFAAPPNCGGSPAKRARGECISDARRAVVWFFHKRAPSINLEAPHHNPRTKGASNLSPLRTFGPVGRQPSSPQGLSIRRQPPKRENAEMVREVYDSLFFPSYLSFPLEGKSREAGKGVRGRELIGCSIAVLTANRRPTSCGMNKHSPPEKVGSKTAPQSSIYEAGTPQGGFLPALLPALRCLP